MDLSMPQFQLICKGMWPLIWPSYDAVNNHPARLAERIFSQTKALLENEKWERANSDFGREF